MTFEQQLQHHPKTGEGARLDCSETPSPSLSCERRINASFVRIALGFGLARRRTRHRKILTQVVVGPRRGYVTVRNDLDRHARG